MATVPVRVATFEEPSASVHRLQALWVTMKRKPLGAVSAALLAVIVLTAIFAEVLAPYDAMSVGEAFGVGFDAAPLYTDARRGELSMIFHFEIVRLDRDNWRKTAWTLPQLKATYTRIDRAAGRFGWNTSFLCNHDNPRTVSHFGDDAPAWHQRPDLVRLSHRAHWLTSLFAQALIAGFAPLLAR